MSIESLRDARVLVLGATGFLGARITRMLCNSGVTPHLLVRSKNRMSHINDLLDSTITHIGDLTDLGNLSGIIKAVQPEIIIHAAGYGSHRGEGSRVEIFNNNVLAANNLLVSTEPFPGCRIIFSGSSLEQGKIDRPVKEGDPIDPISHYAACKSAATILMRQAARHESRPIVILRPFAMFGYGEPTGRLVPTAIRAGLENTVLKLTSAGYVRDYIFVDDVADAYLRAAVSNKVTGETINIAGGVSTSNEAMVTLIEKHLGQPIKIETGAYNPRVTDTHFWQADTSKASELLDWKPAHSLDAGVEKTINWFRKNGFNY